MKLWDKGYDIDGFTESFTIGKDRELDVMLAGADVIGNLAHLKMLHAVGLMNGEEYKSLQRALVDIYGMVERGEFVIAEGIEDVHSQIELLLVRECGDAGKKIHTGRSRNDQVLLDLKLFTREAIFETLEHIERLFDLLIRRAEENKDVLIPGYTHLQVAMPSSFGLWFGAYAESLADDLLALKAAYDMVNTNPLGSGAGYGSSIALNRQMTTDLLGFSSLAYNVVYAQMQRGKMEKNVLFGLAAVATTLGRLAADVCLFACNNFGFVHLPDKYTTGSSIMPHKKNPISAENMTGLSRLIRTNALAALENQALWHERDISHSSVERVIMPDSTILTDYVLHRLCRRLEGLRIRPENMARNMECSFGLYFSQRVLTALIETGIPRQEAYVMVQRNAMKSWETRQPFPELIKADPEINSRLSEETFAGLIDPQFYLRHEGDILKRVFEE